MFVSLLDVLVSIAYVGENKILGVLRVLRLLRTLRPLRLTPLPGLIVNARFLITAGFQPTLLFRVISRAPGLKLVVETLITSLRPIGNIVLICCTFFIVFGILGVQVNSPGLVSHAQLNWIVFSLEIKISEFHFLNFIVNQTPTSSQ